MRLFHREIGEGKPLIVLHGLFGSADNWLSIAKELGSQFKIYLVDQRNHGQSPHHSEFNYLAMAADLKEWIVEQGIEMPHILGHSMGGKTAMQYCALHGKEMDRLIVVDIGPKAYPVHHDRILEGLTSMDVANIKSRVDADRHLATYVDEMGIRQFLLKNLTRKQEGGFEWKINLPSIKENIKIIGEELKYNSLIDNTTLFIRGKNSHYILDEDFDFIQGIFPNSVLETVPNAGHWVHAEQPATLLQLVRPFLQ